MQRQRFTWRPLTLGRQIALLALLLCLGLGVGQGPTSPAWAGEGGTTAATAQGCATTPLFVGLDGRRYLEIRRAPAAQKLDEYVRRANARLLEVAQDHTVQPHQLVVQDEPPSPWWASGRRTVASTPNWPWAIARRPASG